MGKEFRPRSEHRLRQLDPKVLLSLSPSIPSLRFQELTEQNQHGDDCGCLKVQCDLAILPE